MKARNPIAQAVILIVVASVIAVVSNAFAGRTRRIVLPAGFYPNALKVPPKEPQVLPPPPRLEPVTSTASATNPAAPTTLTTTAPAATATIAQSPAPGQPPIAIPTTTIERPAAGVPTTTAPAPAQAAPAAPRVDLAKFQPHPDKAFVDISGEEAVALHGAGALFLDARRTSVYEAGHIAGARSFSVWEADIDDKVNQLFEQMQDDQNKPIVIYCSGGACEDSHMLAQKLWGIQFNNVYVYKDGFPDWQRRNGAQKTGGQP